MFEKLKKQVKIFCNNREELIIQLEIHKKIINSYKEKVMQQKKILESIKDTDKALGEIEKMIVSYKNIVDDKTKEFLERIKERIQKLRLPKLQ
jgi:hypothetical protein